MRRFQRATILVSLVESLRDQDSWCGETNIQKAAYFLQEMLHVPLDFEFTLYKYGPYSFDLSEELTYLCADSFLEFEVRSRKYGPSYIPGEMRDFLIDRFPKTLKRYQKKTDYVANRLGSKNVLELERLATALYVRLDDDNDSTSVDRASTLRKLKPHISKDDAKKAVQDVNTMFEEIKALD